MSKAAPKLAEAAAVHIGSREAARIIEDGDIILFKGAWLISKIFERLTGALYSHSAFAIHWEGAAMICEADEEVSKGGATKGVQALVLRAMVKKYNGTSHLFRLKPEYKNQLKMEDFRREALKDLGLPFGTIPLLKDFLYRFLHFPKPSDEKRPHSLFCSEYVARAFAAGGVTFCPGREFVDTMPMDIYNSGKLYQIGILHYDE